MANEETTGTKNGEKKTSVFRKKSVIIILLLLIIVCAGGVYWYIQSLKYVSTDDAFIEADRLSVSAKMLDRITYLAAAEGDTVQAGQVIVKLDTTDLKAQLDQANAAVKNAEVSINLAKAHLDKANDDFARADKQYELNIIPKENYDHAKQAVEIAKAELSIAESKVVTARSQVNVIQTSLENTVISAPFKGVVAKKWMLVGDVVQPGQPIYTIYDVSDIWVTAEMEETKLSSFQLGDSVNISVDAYPDTKFTGVVYQIGNNTAAQFSLIPPSNASGNFTKVTQRIPVKISINQIDPANRTDDKKALLPGMSVVVDIKIK